MNCENLNMIQGQFIFGTVQPAQPYCMFPIDYSALNATEEDKEPFR